MLIVDTGYSPHRPGGRPGTYHERHKFKPRNVVLPLPPAITFRDSFGTFRKHDGHKKVKKKDKQQRVYP